MAEFEEPIVRDTAPATKLEHDLRYRSARFLVMKSQVWCDLGCGDGVAAATAVDRRYPGRAVLVDIDESAVRVAEHEIEASEMHALRADLASKAGVTLVREALLTDPPAQGCITCFELIQHLTTFVPLLEFLIEAAATERYTVLLSVPNDAYSATQNASKQSTWGDAALDELRRLLPADHVVARQLELRGSTLVRADGGAALEREATFALPETAVASHFVAAFGPRAQQLEETVRLHVGDRAAERMWEQQRESDLAFYRALASSQEARIAAKPAQNTQGAWNAPPAP